MEQDKNLRLITELPALLSGLACPSCHETRYSKIGKEKGIQRYKCKKCGKSYRSTTGSTIHKLHKKQLIEKYITCMEQGYTLRKAARETGISLATAFAWRHKLLSALTSKKAEQINKNNTTSAFTIPYSEKGQRKPTNTEKKPTISILTTDNSGHLRITVIQKRTNDAIQILEQISNTSKHIPHKSLPHLIKSATAQNISSNEVKKNENIQQQLKQWIDRFRGVASKYLQHYWAWYCILHKLEIKKQNGNIFLEKCIS